jgi:aminopeptidase
MTQSNFDSDFHRYAELIAAHGLNVQRGQMVNINTEPIHRDFALLIAEKCYERGAKFVDIALADPRNDRLRIDKSQGTDLSFVPDYYTKKFVELTDKQACNLRIIGMEFPDLLSAADPTRVQTLTINRQKAIKYFFDNGVGRSQVHWCVVAAATPLWGKKIYPALTPEKACEALWQDILAMCRADKPACLDLWREHNERLQRRAKKLTEMKIKELRFVGPGTDLVVGLTDRAIWKGGQERSARGLWFEPNLPTEEVFTTPDFRRTSGHVRATRPFMINGKMIENLSAKFENGAIADFMASGGADTFKAYISSDEGARRLGEVALVGIDSPVYKAGKVFQEILFDENAACHIAVGQAYKFCIEGGTDLDSAGAAAGGCNESAVHTDMMISNADVDVSATLYDGRALTLIQAGEWTADFR